MIIRMSKIHRPADESVVPIDMRLVAFPQFAEIDLAGFALIVAESLCLGFAEKGRRRKLQRALGLLRARTKSVLQVSFQNVIALVGAYADAQRPAIRQPASTRSTATERA